MVFQSCCYFVIESFLSIQNYQEENQIRYT